MKIITPEIKKRIFAQYFGNTYYYKNEFGYFKEQVEFGYNTNSHLEKKVSFLHLTSLSNITDEDCNYIANSDIVDFRNGLIGSWDGKNQSELYDAVRNDIEYFSDYVPIYHYLVSKGYALSYLDYSVEDLVELGVYKLKN